jgi:hypothetical protein
MKTILRTITLAFCLALLLPFGARAYYSPEQGRWISRDPLGEKGGQNLYGFVSNAPVDHSDYLGLAEPWPGYPGGSWGPGVSCSCVCKDVEVTYEPGGESLELGPYTLYAIYFGQTGFIPVNHAFGNQVHVVWKVAGNPGGCRYYQDEKGSSVKSVRAAPTPLEETRIGVNGNRVRQIYTDWMGRRFGFYSGPLNEFAGDWTMEVQWNVTFRCESEAGSGGTTKTKTHVFSRSAQFKVPWW